MEQVIERIKRGAFWKFHGGIHPPQQKFLTNKKPIRNIELPKQLIIPLQQHIGSPAKVLVSVGEHVLKGQALSFADNPMAVPIHAPTSGIISAIEKATIAHPSGLKELCIFLTPDGEDKWIKRNICSNYQSLSAKDIVSKIANAGISGMGGAGFPTYIKVNSQAPIKYLIINAAECEPYITADDLLIREQAASIVDGIQIIDKLLQPEFIFIGIEDNKPEAIKTLQQITESLEKISVCVLPTIYPSGGEKQLIKILTGEEVPTGVIPNKLGIVMQNVATCFAITDAVINDKPLISRIVTVSGQALNKPQNIRSLIGTPIQHLLDHCGYRKSETQQIIMGGPMMGYTLPSAEVPIIKTTNCILVPTSTEISPETNEVECIRCGQCADVCPSQLLPQELQWSAKAKDQKQLQKLNLSDCIECGACAYVCPSQIPLVHYYRIAKAEIREQKQLDIKAENAKSRFEARKLRLEKAKIAREEKHKKSAEARKLRMNAGTSSANQEKSAVADALARVKAKKLAAQKPTESGVITTDSADKKVTSKPIEKTSKVASAIAKAKAKKLAAQKSAVAAVTTSETSDNIITNKPVEKSSKVADTKTKAKKLATKKPSKAASNTSQSTEKIAKKPVEMPTKITATETKAKVKAKKTTPKKPVKKEVIAAESKNANNNSVTLSDKSENEINDITKVESLNLKRDQKVKIAAAVAKAKAKKVAEQQSIDSKDNETVIKASTDKNLSNTPKILDDDKKKRIAEAVAKAKAKKQQQELT